MNILVGLDAIEDFLSLKLGRPLKLKGKRAEAYANWRLTFECEVETQSLHILDFEDYH